MLIDGIIELASGSTSGIAERALCKSKMPHQSASSPPSPASASDSPTASLFLSLPAEIHLMIFAHLDTIDSVCLSLSSITLNSLFNSYHNLCLPPTVKTDSIKGSNNGVARRGPIPLNTRRSGPNELEAAWLSLFPEGGKRECELCLKRRCELWRHVRVWVLSGLSRGMEGKVWSMEVDVPLEQVGEYCAVRKRFGRWEGAVVDTRAAGEEADDGENVRGELVKREWRRTGCWRGCPGKPWVCGKHSPLKIGEGEL